MKTAEALAETLVKPALNAPSKGRRKLVAVVGPPASGKSTLSDILAARLCDNGCRAAVVPMDGFHLDNSILERRGDLARKGAPHTFDASGFLRLVAALANDAEVFYPTFDRDRDIAVAGSGMVDGDCDTVIVEGNYLLHDAPIWRDLSAFWDFAIRLDVAEPVLEQRLMARWIDQGLSEQEAKERTQANDLPNAKLVSSSSLPADLSVQTP